MGGSESNQASISRPYYPAKPGSQAGVNKSPEELRQEQLKAEKDAQDLNNEYRHENPLLALADDAATLTKNAIYLAIGLSFGYLSIEAYKAYKK